MIDLIKYGAYAASILAIVTTAILCLGLAFRRVVISTQSFQNCLDQVKTSQNMSVIMVILAWLLISGQARKTCLQGYLQLSAMCSRIGSTWIAMALATLVFGVWMSLWKHSGEDLKKMASLRKSCLIQGAAYFMISFLLNIEG